MCNRYAFEVALDALASAFGAVVADDSLIAPRYNVAPGHRAPVIVRGAATRSLVAGYFGFRGRSRGRDVLHLNARSETVRRLPAFRELIASRRCVVPATRFYEFSPASEPFAYAVAGARVFGFPALYADATAKQPGPRFCLLTAPGCEAMREIGHDRMPLIVDDDGADAWLVEGAIPAPLDADRFERVRVSRRLNPTGAAYADDAGLLDPVDADPELF